MLARHPAAANRAQQAHAVAGAEEGEIGLQDLGEVIVKPRLDLALHRRLVRIGGVERAAADDDAGVPRQIQIPRPFPLQPQLMQLHRRQAGLAGEGQVLRVGGRVLGARRQQQVRLHVARHRGPRRIRGSGHPHDRRPDRFRQ